MNWECARAHMHFTRSACLSGWRSAACAPCVTNPSSGSTQTLPRVLRGQWIRRRCEGAGQEETGLPLQKTHTLNTLGMMDSGHLKDISQEMLIMNPSGRPAADLWAICLDGNWILTAPKWFGQISQGVGGWIGSFHKKMLLVLLPYCTVHQKRKTWQEKEPH